MKASQKRKKKTAKFEFGAVRKCENLIDLEKPENMSIWMYLEFWTQKSALMQLRPGPLKLDLPPAPRPHSINYLWRRS